MQRTAVLVLLLSFIAVFSLHPTISQAQGAPPGGGGGGGGTQEQLIDLDERVSVLEGQDLDTRITTLENQDLDGRLSTLEDEVPNVEATANSALSEALLADQRLDVLEADRLFLRTLIVNPVGPTDLDNGAELLSVVAASASISPVNWPVVVLVEPGSYDVTGSTVVVPGHVILRGSGPSATTIYSSSSNSVVTAKVVEDLSIRNTAASHFTALNLSGFGTKRLANVRVTANQGGLNFVGFGESEISDAIIRSNGLGFAAAFVQLNSGATVTVRDSSFYNPSTLGGNDALLIANISSANKLKLIRVEANKVRLDPTSIPSEVTILLSTVTFSSSIPNGYLLSCRGSFSYLLAPLANDCSVSP